MALRLRRPPGLTSRGLSFVVAGAVLVAIGWVGAFAPAVMFGVLVGLLPVILAGLTHGLSGDVSLKRTLSVAEVPTGGTIDVTLSVRSRLGRGRSLLVEDLAPAALGGSHRIALRGPGGQSIAAAHYRLAAQARGEHTIGPVRLHTVDPFGLVHRVRELSLHSGVLAHPAVVPLDPIVLGGAAMTTGAGHRGAPGAASDDLVPRTYRPGDEVRRVDWKATARTGDLMVRSEESLRRASLTVVLDLGEEHHFGREPRSSVDVLLGLAASVGVLALSEGWDVEMRTVDDVRLFAGSAAAGSVVERRELLRALATAPLSDEPAVAATLRHSVDSTGPLLLLAGAGSAWWARQLTGIGGHSARRLAVLVAAHQWATPSAHSLRTPAWRHSGDPDGSAPATLSEEFRAAGWRVAVLERDGSAADVWAELGAA